LLADDYILPSLQNFSISILIGQLVALLYDVYTLVFFAVLLGCLKTVYARAILIDFTKAFDIVNHTGLTSLLILSNVSATAKSSVSEETSAPSSIVIARETVIGEAC